MRSEPTTIHVGFDQITADWGGSPEVIAAAGNSSARIRPFLKWAGGKQWLSPLAALWLPTGFEGTYYEPFLGGAASYFAASPATAVLADRCSELINAYRALQQDPERVVETLRRYPHTQAFFEEMRKRKPRTLHTEAARFIYLNKTAFNGLYRVNRQGEFNVPFGRFKNPTICNAARLRDAAKALSGVVLRDGDFEDSISSAGAGDFVYLDPPYITGHQNNGFLKYNAPLFAWGDQERLSRVACALRDESATVVVSNSDHDAVTALYSGFFYYRLKRNSLIGGSSGSRGAIDEALLSSVPILDLPTVQIDG